ncbi:RNA polymerase beta'' subunit family protein [Mesomycoplasma neurolyticum]|uniref:Uncharacterized protein n=1 Tax=Mesomycoplasma neurolyticum TaxID=2120 RepID=A0A449A5L7_9BACT|nr:hypothetical protein [Mesomycoplasma neurolyticum]VEU59551.1 Uncharacterised protein [Mesomycoplasma neurolyticum]
MAIKRKKILLLLSLFSTIGITTGITIAVLNNKKNKTNKKEIKFLDFIISNNQKIGINFELDDLDKNKILKLNLIDENEPNKNLSLSSQIKNSKIYFDFNELELNKKYIIKSISDDFLTYEIINLNDQDKIINNKYHKTEVKFVNFDISPLNNNLKIGINFELDDLDKNKILKLNLIDENEPNKNLSLSSRIKNSKIYFDFNELELNKKYIIKSISDDFLTYEIINLNDQDKIINNKYHKTEVKFVNFDISPLNNNLKIGINFETNLLKQDEIWKLNLIEENKPDNTISILGEVQDKNIYFSFKQLETNKKYKIHNISNIKSNFEITDLNDKNFEIFNSNDEIEISKIKWKHVSNNYAIIDVFYDKEKTKLLSENSNVFKIQIINKNDLSEIKEYESKDFNKDTYSATFVLNKLTENSDYKIIKYSVNKTQTKDFISKTEEDDEINLTKNFKDFFLNYHIEKVYGIDVKTGKEAKNLSILKISLESEKEKLVQHGINSLESDENAGEDAPKLFLTLKDLKQNKYYIVDLFLEKENENNHKYITETFRIGGLDDEGRPDSSLTQDYSPFEINIDEIKNNKIYFDNNKINITFDGITNYGSKLEIVDLKIIYDSSKITKYQDNEKSKDAIENFYKNNVIQLIPIGNKTNYIDFSSDNSSYYELETKYENEKLKFIVKPKLLKNKEEQNIDSLLLEINTNFGPNYKLEAEKDTNNPEQWIVTIDKPLSGKKYFLNSVIANKDQEIFKKTLEIQTDFIIPSLDIDIKTINFDNEKNTVDITFVNSDDVLDKYKFSKNILQFESDDDPNIKFESILVFDLNLQKWISNIKSSFLNKKYKLKKVIFGNSDLEISTNKIIDLSLKLNFVETNTLNEYINKIQSLFLSKRWWASGIKKKFESINSKENNILNIIDLTNIQKLIPEIKNSNISVYFSDFSNEDELKGTLKAKVKFISGNNVSNEKTVEILNLYSSKFLSEIRQNELKAQKDFEEIIKPSSEGMKKSSTEFDNEFRDIHISHWDPSRGFGFYRTWIDMNEKDNLEKLKKFFDIDESLLDYDKSKVKLFFIKIRDDRDIYSPPSTSYNAMFGIINYELSFWTTPEDFPKEKTEDPESKYSLTPAMEAYNFNNPQYNIVAYLKEKYEKFSENDNTLFNTKYGLTENIEKITQELKRKNKIDQWTYLLENSKLKQDLEDTVKHLRYSISKYPITRGTIIYELANFEIVEYNNQKFLDVYLILKSKTIDEKINLLFNSAIKLRFSDVK